MYIVYINSYMYAFFMFILYQSIFYTYIISYLSIYLYIYIYIYIYIYMVKKHWDPLLVIFTYQF